MIATILHFERARRCSGSPPDRWGEDALAVGSLLVLLILIAAPVIKLLFVLPKPTSQAVVATTKATAIIVLTALSNSARLIWVGLVRSLGADDAAA